MTQTLASANVSAAVLAAAADLASRRILACLLPVRPPRHGERRTKCRQQFPSAPATGRVPASTGKAAVTIYPAGQITPSLRHVQRLARLPQTAPNQPGLGKRHRRRKTAPGPWNRRQPRGDIRAVVMPAATAKRPGSHTETHQGRYNSKSV